jgi:hypothetical protein
MAVQLGLYATQVGHVAVGDGHDRPAASTGVGQDVGVADQEHPGLGRALADSREDRRHLGPDHGDQLCQLVGPAGGVVALAWRPERAGEAQLSAADDDVGEAQVVTADAEGHQGGAGRQPPYLKLPDGKKMMEVARTAVNENGRITVVNLPVRRAGAKDMRAASRSGSRTAAPSASAHYRDLLVWAA